MVKGLYTGDMNVHARMPVMAAGVLTPAITTRPTRLTECEKGNPNIGHLQL